MPKSSYPLYVEGKGNVADYYVTNPHFGAFINQQSFLKNKPADLTRIFVVGGSAAFGFPYSEDYGFSGYLRRALDKVYPGKFEVVNGSGMSFGSHRVIDILKDVVLFEPDMVIIYSGNNEYVERNILPEVKKGPAAMEKIGALFNQTDIYRAIRLALYKATPKTFESQVEHDITDIRFNPNVNRGDIGRSQHTDSTILENYGHNIAAMKRLLVEQGIKVILCTVPVDIGGWLPKSGIPKFTGEAAAQRWLQLLDLREEAFQMRNLPLEADYMRQALEITPDDPGMHFNYGKVLWMLSQYEASYQELVMAKDLDYRPTRALSSFNEVIRANTDESVGVYLADLELMMKEKFLQGEAKGIFLDYCHLTDSGHKLVTTWLLPELAEAISPEKLDAEVLSPLIRVDPKALTMNDYVRGHELYAQALTFENNNLLEKAEENYLQAMKYLPNFDHIYTNLGHIYVKFDDLERASEMYDRALQLNPKNHKVLLSLGYMSIQDKNFDQAVDYFNRTISISAIIPGAYQGLGEIAMKREDFQEAIKNYNESLRLGNDSVWLRKSMAQAFLSLGDTENAIRNWQIALKFNPFDQETRSLVGKYSR